MSVVDADADVAAEAVELGVADIAGPDPSAEVTFIAAPVGAIPQLALETLAASEGLVTDVGSTKAEVCRLVDHPRFVGGHPMAGSEQDGVRGADPDLFSGAMWVLTPTDATDEASFAAVAGIIRSLGSEVIALAPQVHDELVAQVSHVPHLTAAALMCLADDTSVEHRALLRLAAGGFRDMTRISSGRPTIWPDICLANSEAIMHGIDGLIEALADIKGLIESENRDGLLTLLNKARQARTNLPTGFRVAERVAEVAVPIPDRPGEIAAIATLASELDVNILDLDISHSGEGGRGVMLLMVDADLAERLMGGLMARSYRPTLRALT
ncbi:MAG: prephenate dehydrogenase [Acidimicrobiales bacterium]